MAEGLFCIGISLFTERIHRWLYISAFPVIPLRWQTLLICSFLLKTLPTISHCSISVKHSCATVFWSYPAPNRNLWYYLVAFFKCNSRSTLNCFHFYLTEVGSNNKTCASNLVCLLSHFLLQVWSYRYKGMLGISLLIIYSHAPALCYCGPRFLSRIPSCFKEMTTFCVSYIFTQPGILQSSQSVTNCPSAGFRPQATQTLENAFVSFISSWHSFQRVEYSWLVNPISDANQGFAELTKISEFSRQRLPIANI